jgi:AcrR family transcriptional regulator
VRANAQSSKAGFSERQKEVLEAALRLLVEEGDVLTMTAVARQASCSKETLYRWFGDRHGLLTAIVQWQALGVRVPPVDRERLDVACLAASLEQFANDWLKVISSKTSIALNRLAVSEAGSDKNSLGAIVLENGRFEMGRRLKPVLEAGREARLLAFGDTETAFKTFFGLVARDVQIRLLLGERLDMTEAEIGRDAARATRQFLALCGATSEAGAARLRLL